MFVWSRRNYPSVHSFRSARRSRRSIAVFWRPSVWYWSAAICRPLRTLTTATTTSNYNVNLLYIFRRQISKVLLQLGTGRLSIVPFVGGADVEHSLFSVWLAVRASAFFLRRFARRCWDTGNRKGQRCFDGSGYHNELFILHSTHSQVPFLPMMVVPSTSAAPPCSTITQPRHFTEVRPCAHVYGRCAKDVNERVYGS